MSPATTLDSIPTSHFWNTRTKSQQQQQQRTLFQHTYSHLHIISAIKTQYKGNSTTGTTTTILSSSSSPLTSHQQSEFSSECVLSSTVPTTKCGWKKKLNTFIPWSFVHCCCYAQLTMLSPHGVIPFLVTISECSRIHHIVGGGGCGVCECWVLLTEWERIQLQCRCLPVAFMHWEKLCSVCI